MSKPSIYYATPIRGKKGVDASIEYMATNCGRAKHNVGVLQAAFPRVEWISVAPYDRIVQKLLARKQVNISDVLQSDFEVGDECEGLFAHLWEPSGGADQEFERQSDAGKTCLRLELPDWRIWYADMKVIDQFVWDVIKNHYPLKNHYLLY